MPELKACPFCGHEKTEVFHTGLGNYRVRCNSCLACSGVEFKPDDATAAWNRRVGQWISVKERLPENGADVLVYIAGSEIVLVDFNKGCWYLEGYGCLGRGEVTHWMPLPQPPEKEGVQND